jgi:hypothetical protein
MLQMYRSLTFGSFCVHSVMRSDIRTLKNCLITEKNGYYGVMKHDGFAKTELFRSLSCPMLKNENKLERRSYCANQ